MLLPGQRRCTFRRANVSLKIRIDSRRSQTPWAWKIRRGSQPNFRELTTVDAFVVADSQLSPISTAHSRDSNQILAMESIM